MHRRFTISHSAGSFAATLLLTSLCWAGSGRAIDRFNDDDPKTEALEIWRITKEQTVRHHSNYHNVDPFSPNGRYVIYTIAHPPRLRDRAGQRRPPPTFAVFDLHTGREVFRATHPAIWPIWARHDAVIYWVRGAHPTADRTLCRLNLSQNEARRCDDRAVRRLAGGLGTISHDDCTVYAVGPKAWDSKAQRDEWVVWAVDTDSPSPPSVFFQHALYPEHIAYEPRANPTKPVMLLRRVVLERTAKGVRRIPERPHKFLVDLKGRYLGTALPVDGRSGHLCWSGDGELLVLGDGPLRGRGSPFVEPGDWKILSTERTSDPSPCGFSGQWLIGITGINGQLFVSDTQTAHTRRVCCPASIIHQPRDDKRDLSGAYDSDAHGSPDGTKIYFSTNYSVDRYPVTRTLSRVRKSKDGAGPAVLGVETTAGFPQSGVLSVWSSLVKYERKEPTRFLGCDWRQGDTRLPTAIEPGAVVTDYRGRCVKGKWDPAAPLADQAATDVYIAVVRQPDPPALTACASGVCVHPGHNHREIHAYQVVVDGQPAAILPAETIGQSVVLEGGGRATVRAVEWSGLTSPDSRSLTVSAGTSVTLSAEPAARPPEDEPEVIRKDGKVVERRYHSPDGWPCQVLHYGPDGSARRRELFRGPGRFFSVEEYSPDGRRAKETIFNREGNMSEWTRFEGGVPVERWLLRYGLFPLREIRQDGRWIKDVRPRQP